MRPLCEKFAGKDFQIKNSAGLGIFVANGGMIEEYFGAVAFAWGWASSTLEYRSYCFGVDLSVDDKCLGPSRNIKYCPYGSRRPTV